MKIKTKKELHDKSIADLKKLLKEASGANRLLRLDHQQGKLKNTSSLSEKRVEIAVIKTIINEKSEENKSASVKVSSDKKGGSK